MRMEKQQDEDVSPLKNRKIGASHVYFWGTEDFPNKKSTNFEWHLFPWVKDMGNLCHFRFISFYGIVPSCL